MTILALAIVLSTVLYLVDKNRKWGAFGRVVGVVTIVAAIGLSFEYLRERRNAKEFAKAEVEQWAAEFETKWNSVDYPKRMSPEQCAKMVRDIAPVAYDEMDDSTMLRTLEAKYPHICADVVLPGKSSAQPR